MMRSILCAICILAVTVTFSTDSSFAASSYKEKTTGVKARVVAHRTVKVSWKQTNGADGYVVYSSKKRFGSFRKVASVGKKATSAKIRGLNFGKKYYFKVRPIKKVKNKTVYGKYSKRIKCVIGPAPSSVSALAVFETTKRIKVTFKKSKGASGYEIWRATKKTGKYKRIKVLTAGKRNYTNTGLKANKQYYYKIRPFAKIGKKKVYGGYSKVVTDITGGNSSRYALGKTKAVKSSLKGRKILFLGSSITYGSGSVPKGVSFVNYLAKRDGIIAEKKAKSGTTISTVKKNNYVDRLRTVKYDSKRSLVVCQLSTNDARSTLNVEAVSGDESIVPLGEEGGEGEEGDTPETPAFDDLNELYKKANTVEGAIDYIVAYSGQVLKCPVAFYVVPPFKSTGTFDADFYREMRQALYKSQGFWNENGYKVYVMDMQNTAVYPEFKGFLKYNDKRAFYMKDSVHPTKAGYLKKYVPAFERFLKSLK